MKKILLTLTLCAFASVPALQAGDSAKPCTEAAKATCADTAKASTCADSAKTACCSSTKKVAKVLHSPRGALLARR